ncbi:imm11 family protein [Archangium lansingense]|uniref:imm11 family protein n=1 Tax=Archangium lansingense TaxID=2995310 RepID=UPI003B7A1DBA
MSAPPRYFELLDEMSVPGRWVVYQKDIDEHGRQVDPWQFKRGTLLQVEGRPMLGIAHPGIPLDFSLTELATPVVTGRFVSLFEQLELGNEVQFIPAQVEGQTEPFFILNVLHVIRCIDDARCEHVSYWTPEDGEPELVGKYQNVRGLKVDPARMGWLSICRPRGWTGAIIITERIKLAMERAGITGLRLREA